MRALCIFASSVLAGCATFNEVNAGPVVALPTSEDASGGGAVALHGGIGTSSEGATTSVGMDPNAKLKATRDTQNIAFGDGFFLTRAIGSGGAGTVRAGLHLVFERYDEKLLVGGGPYAAVMGGIALESREYFVPGQFFAHTRRDRTLFTFGPAAELDARFSRPSSVAFLGIAVGIAWASEVVSTGPNLPIQSPPPPFRNPTPNPFRP